MEENPNPLFDPNALLTLSIDPPGKGKSSPVYNGSEAGFALLKSLSAEQSQKDDKLFTPQAINARLVAPENLSNSEAFEASRYLDRGETYLRGRNNEAVAASHQGFWSRTWNDVKGFGANLAGSVIQAPLAIPQVIKATKALVTGEGLSKAGEYMRGEEGSYMHDINQWTDSVQENSTNFQSDWAAKNPWKNMIPFYGGEGGTDFGSLVRSGGFIIGGIAQSMAEGAIGGLLAPETAGASLAIPAMGITSRVAKAFQGLSTIGKPLKWLTDAIKLNREAEGALRGVDTLTKVGKLWNGVETPLGNLGIRSTIHGFLLANGEASLEGYGAEKDMEQKLLQQYRSQYGVEADAQTRQDIHKAAVEAGNSVFLLNHALLGFSNRFQIDTILRNFSSSNRLFGQLPEDLFKIQRKAGTSLFEAVENKTLPTTIGPNDKWYWKGLGKEVDAAKATGAYGALALSDAFEEQLQKSIQDGTQSYYQYKYNHGGKADMDNVLSAASHGLSEAFGTQAGWQEFVGGLVSAGLFGGGSKKIIDTLNKPGIQKQFETYAQQLNLSKDAVQSMVQGIVSDTGLTDSILNKAGSVNSQLTAAQVQASAAKQNDQFVFQNQRNTGQFAFLAPFVYQGTGDILREQFDSFKSDIDKDSAEFARSYGLDENTPKEHLLEGVNRLGDALSRLEHSYSRFQLLFPNPYKLTRNATDEEKELHQDWKDYQLELLHNDFLRQQYGKRLTSLKSEYLVLGENVPYVNDKGWKTLRQSLLTEQRGLDNVISQAKQDIRSSAAEGTSVDKELERVEKDLLNQQQDKRDQIQRRLAIIDGLQQNKFSDYDQLLDGIREDLSLSNPDGDPTHWMSNDVLKQALQASFDAHSLQNSIKRLAELFNGMTSSKGFDSWRKEQTAYKARQLTKEIQKVQQDKNDLKSHVISHFDSKEDAEFHLGDLNHYAETHLDEYRSNPDQTKQRVTEEIGTVKVSKQDEKTKHDQDLRDLTDLVESDKQVQKIRNRNDNLDPDGKVLSGLVQKLFTENSTIDLPELATQIANEYAKKYPKPVVTKSTSATTPTSKTLEDEFNEEIPGENEPVEIGELQDMDDLFGDEPFVKPVVTNQAKQKGITQSQYDKLSPEHKKLVNEVPVGDPRLGQVYDAIGHTTIGGLGSIQGKFFVSGMTLVNDEPRTLTSRDLSDDTLRADWFDIVKDRLAIASQTATGTPLSDLVEWSIVSPSDSRVGNLPMDYGLARSSTDQYLVATGNDSAKAVIVIPLGKSLLVREETLDMLINQDWVTPGQRDKLARLDIPYLSDVLDIVGEKGYNWMKDTRLVNVMESYKQFTEFNKSFNEAVDSIQATLENGEVTDKTVSLLNRLSIGLSISRPFNSGTKRFKINDLLFSTIDGEKSLMVQKRTVDGVTQYKYVKNNGGLNNIVIEELYEQKYQKQVEQLLDNRNLLDGNYLMVRAGDNGSLYALSVKQPEGLQSLLDLLVKGKKFSATGERFYLQNEDHLPLEIDAGRLDQGELFVRYVAPSSKPFEKNVNETEKEKQARKQEELSRTKFSKPIYVQNIINRYKHSSEQAATQLQAELNKAVNELTSDFTDKVKVYKGSDNKYDWDVAIDSASVFQRVDVAWNLGTENPVTSQIEVEVLPSLILPQVSTTMDTKSKEELNPTPPTESTKNLQKLETLLPEEARPLISQEISERGLKINESILEEKLKNPKWVDLVKNLKLSDTAKIESILASLTRVQQGTYGSVPTTRLQTNQGNLQQEVNELMKRCL